MHNTLNKIFFFYPLERDYQNSKSSNWDIMEIAWTAIHGMFFGGIKMQYNVNLLLLTLTFMRK